MKRWKWSRRYLRLWRHNRRYRIEYSYVPGSGASATWGRSADSSIDWWMHPYVDGTARGYSTQYFWAHTRWGARRHVRRTLAYYSRYHVRG